MNIKNLLQTIMRIRILRSIEKTNSIGMKDIGIYHRLFLTKKRLQKRILQKVSAKSLLLKEKIIIDL